jgi:2-oxo-4-hydroxy-4-carboxy-5-ureidoimidazoline decarboxylase
VTLAELNACDRARFVAAIGGIFEHSPWVAERAWERRPFASVDELHTAMTLEVARAPLPKQLALLRGHPDLGTRARMSDSSTAEQSGAGLDSMAPAEFERLQRLNTAYWQKFGFPFLFAVKGSTVSQILAAMEERLPSTPDAELAEALRQVSRIAHFRLEVAISVG